MKNILNKIKTLFIDGLIVILPISLTVYILYSILTFLYKKFDVFVPLFPLPLRQNVFFQFSIVLATVIVTFISIVFIGFIAKTIAGRTIEKFVENFFIYVPGVNSIFKAFKRLFNLIAQNREDKVSKVVFIEYPNKNKWVLAFMTGKCSEKLSPKKKKKFYTVFMPTTPNPTTGYLLIVEKKDIRETELSMDEAIKIVLSGGIIKEDEEIDPSYFKKARRKIYNKLNK